MKERESVCMIVSMKAREKEYEEFLVDQDGQVWKEMSMAAKPDGRRRKPSRVIKA